MTKLCECGCGSPAPIAKVSNKRWNHVKGQPVRFVHGHHQRRPKPDISEMDLAWLAGLLEGEGSFILEKRTRRPKEKPEWIFFSPRLQVAMLDQDVIARAAGLIGSKFWNRKSAEGRRPLFETVASGWRASELMIQLRPHMGKRRRAQIDKALDGATPPHGRPSQRL